MFGVNKKKVIIEHNYEFYDVFRYWCGIVWMFILYSSNL